MDDVKQFSEELHKKVIRKFPTRKVYAKGKNDIWGLDLNDMIVYKAENDGYVYIFVIEDIYTRKAWCVALKDKKAKTVVDVLETLFKKLKTHPNYIWTDKGGEFYNADMTKLLKKYNIHQYSVYSVNKVAPVERLNQTLKHIMFKILTEKQSHKWIDILDEVVNTYNNNIHSSIYTTPNKAYAQPKNIIDDDLGIYEVKKPQFKTGDYVRVSRLKGNFEKGYDENFTRECYQIVEVDKGYPILYKLNDLMREPIEGSFYEQELQKTDLHDFALVESVLNSRTKNKKKEMFVKWAGYPAKFNSWIPEKQVKHLTKK